MTLTSTARKPWTVERHDQEDGSISYEVWDTNPDSYRRVCSLNDGDNEEGRNAKRDAYTIAALAQDTDATPPVAPTGTGEPTEAMFKACKSSIGPTWPLTTYECARAIYKAMSAASGDPSRWRQSDSTIGLWRRIISDFLADNHFDIAGKSNYGVADELIAELLAALAQDTDGVASRSEETRKKDSKKDR